MVSGGLIKYPVSDINMEARSHGPERRSSAAVLLLDEPTAALAPRMVGELFRRIKEIRDSGVPILLVEQHAKGALQLADRGYVLVAGERAMEGRGADILANEDLKRVFLGQK